MEKLYELYAAFLPVHSRLWKSLAQEEASHAKMLRRLHSDMVAGGTTFSPANLRGEDIGQALAFINRCANDCTNGKADIVTALKAAVFLETGIIEGRFFECFEGLRPDIKSELSTILRQTVDHLKRVESYSVPSP